MRLLLLILSFFLVAELPGQSIEKITALLKERDFIAFKHYIDDFCKAKAGTYWIILRDVVPGYQEGVVNVNEYLKDKNNDRLIGNYELKFLSTRDSIFYYELSKSNGEKKVSDRWVECYLPIDSFSNASEFHHFRAAFSKGYNTELDERELFETSILYGFACGISGEPTEYYLKLDTLVENNDLFTIRKWLKSPNTEKQLYAIHGLERLENAGTILTPEDIRIVRLIARKEGTVNICSGCISFSDSIKNIVPGFVGWHSHNRSSQNKWTLNNILVCGGLLIAILSFSIIYLKRRNKYRGSPITFK
jgi:hypothetical protein